ncbi:MAG: ROK family protein [Parcubacteria group bacterium]|nr:ROK family protein [Parcubacteria group bacterium]
MKHFSLGIDIGGSKINFLIFNFLNRKILFKKRIDIRPKIKKQALLDLVKKEANEIIEKIGRKNILGIGLGVPGSLNIKKGSILKTPNIPSLAGLPIQKIFSDYFKIPVKIENDARAFVLAEYLYGAGQGACSIIGVTLGAGVGGGIMIDGKLWLGEAGSAGEVGHMTINRERRTERQKLLSFEDLVSRKGYLRFSKEKPEILQKRAEAGDKKSIEIFEKIGKDLGIGLANLVNILNPEKIIIGGRLIKAGDLLLRPAKKQMRRLFFSPLAKKTLILRTKLGEDAGAIGAANLFFRVGAGQFLTESSCGAVRWQKSVLPNSSKFSRFKK